MKEKQITVEASLKQQLPLNVLIICATISRQTKKDIYHVLHNMMTNQHQEKSRWILATIVQEQSEIICTSVISTT